ncbi:MAG: polymer-forming cytoskeletal protein [Arenicellales bacterium]
MFKKPNETTHGTSTQPPSRAPVGTGADQLAQSRVKEHRRSVLSPSITVKGDISGTEDLVLEGRMEGSISLPKNEIMIGPEGQVKADITALKVSVEGRLIGDIRGSERVIIKHSGHVEGNIVAPRVVLEDGCQFKGSVEMNIESGSGASTSPKAQEPRSESKTKSDAAPKVEQYGSEAKSRVSGAS